MYLYYAVEDNDSFLEFIQWTKYKLWESFRKPIIVSQNVFISLYVCVCVCMFMGTITFEMTAKSSNLGITLRMTRL